MTEPSPDSPAAFADLLAANKSFAAAFALAGLEGVARAGVAMVTCMDARIDPLAMLGLLPGDAKVLRNPGGRVDDQTLVGLVLAVNLLEVERILIVQHTRCAMTTASEAELRERVSARSGGDASTMTFGVIGNQKAQIREDVARAREHPLIANSVAIGGFLYDVDTGLLAPVA